MANKAKFINYKVIILLIFVVSRKAKKSVVAIKRFIYQETAVENSILSFLFFFIFLAYKMNSVKNFMSKLRFKKQAFIVLLKFEYVANF